MTDKRSDPTSARVEGAHTRPSYIRRVARLNWWVVVATALLGGVLGLVFSLMETPVFQSSSTLYVTSGSDDNASSAYQGSLASQQRVASYSKLVHSDAIAGGAAKASGLDLSVPQARDALSASSQPNTVLLTVSARLENASDSIALSNAAASTLSSFVADLEKPSSGGVPLARLTIVTPATTAQVVSPATHRNIAVGAFVGLLLGVLFVLVRLRLDSRFMSGEDVATAIAYPLLGSVPESDSLVALDSTGFSAGGDSAAESIRKLRANLGFVSVDGDEKCVVVTSALSGEGKSTIAMNLARAFAELGEGRVVLVDSDLRRPSLPALVGCSGAIGVTDYLRGDVGISDIVQTSSVTGLDFVASGSVPPNPAELLGSEKLGSLLEELGGMYDRVIIDSAPVLPVADTAELARSAGSVLLVVRLGRTKRGELARSVDTLSIAGAKIIGVVVNGIDHSDESYIGYGYYSESSPTT